jgi:hypothetical protein
MPMLFWLALIVALLLVIGSALYSTLAGLAAFRDLKRLGREVGAELDRVATATGQIERHLALAAESGSRLEAALARLRESRARLNVLTSAIADVRASVGRVTGVVPKK